MGIQKLVLQVTVLCDTDTLDEAISTYSQMDLNAIHEAINFGEDIGGSVEIASSKSLKDRDEVIDELLKIGNDGTFFDVSLDAAETTETVDA